MEFLSAFHVQQQTKSNNIQIMSRANNTNSNQLPTTQQNTLGRLLEVLNISSGDRTALENLRASLNQVIGNSASTEHHENTRRGRNNNITRNIRPDGQHSSTGHGEVRVNNCRVAESSTTNNSILQKKRGGCRRKAFFVNNEPPVAKRPRNASPAEGDIAPIHTKNNPLLGYNVPAKTISDANTIYLLEKPLKLFIRRQIDREKKVLHAETDFQNICKKVEEVVETWFMARLEQSNTFGARIESLMCTCHNIVRRKVSEYMRESRKLTRPYLERKSEPLHQDNQELWKEKTMHQRGMSKRGFGCITVNNFKDWYQDSKENYTEEYLDEWLFMWKAFLDSDMTLDLLQKNGIPDSWIEEYNK